MNLKPMKDDMRRIVFLPPGCTDYPSGRHYRLLSLLSAIIFSFLITQWTFAGNLTLYGPETFIRSSGAPTVTQRTFNVVNFQAAHTLIISRSTGTGADKDSEDSAKKSNSNAENGHAHDLPSNYQDFEALNAKIYLNGALVVDTQQFKKNASPLKLPVVLAATNQLTVHMLGKPGEQLTLSIERGNQAPIAQAGPDQTVPVSATVQLDGAGSTDSDGDPLTYQWQLAAVPTGSQATLSNPAAMKPTLVIDKPGNYAVDLIVNDGFSNSITDSVVISTVNSAPVADAGPDQSAPVNSIITLDGQASHDVDQDPLTFQWRLTALPAGSQAQLSNPAASLTEVTLDRPGRYTAELIANDGLLNSTPDTVAIDTLNSAPVAAPGADQSVFTGTEVILNGSASSDADDDALTYRWSLLHQPATSTVTLLDADKVQSRFTPDVAGVYVAQLIVQDPVSASTPQTTTVTVTVAAVNHPPVILSNPVTNAKKGVTYVYNLDAQDTDGDTLSYSLSAAPTGLSIAASGKLTWTPSATGIYAVMIEVVDGPGGSVTQSYSITVSDAQDPNLPPDPVTVAPPLDPSTATTLAKASDFLYSGAHPIQTGVTAQSIEAGRVAVIRGKVFDNASQPLPGVGISIKDHPEFGQTLSRADGQFDMAVNGGGGLTVNYTKTGFLPVQRQVNAPWGDYVRCDDVVMIAPDTHATLIDLTNTSQAFQVAQGSVSTDVDGNRQATVLFPQGTTATMTLADGTTQALTGMTVRATEYTVGENGPKRMPGPLPPSSGYTYAVELSVDEALAAGAKTVSFNQKIPVYVDNFLNFPIGEIVPVGYYDRDKNAWIPSENGKVIKILSIANGQAEIDSNGDAVADDATLLAALTITDAERTQLAALYSAGKSLWRVQINHLTPWDCNWPFGPPADAKVPLVDDPSNPNNKNEPKEPQTDADKTPKDPPCEAAGCVIQVENQVLGEDFPVTGTEFSLHYRSDRVAGRTTGRTINIPLSGSTIPASLKGIKLTVNVAGQSFIENFPAAANQSKVFTWNGLDAFGRKIPEATATIQIEYLYTLQYYAAQSDAAASFALPGSSTSNFIGSRSGSTISIARRWQKHIFRDNPIPATGLGAVNLSVLHAYDIQTKTVYKGDGSFVKGVENIIPRIIETIAGTGVAGFSGDGGLAKEAALQTNDIAIDATGNLYIADIVNHRIRKITPDGMITTVVGNGVAGFSGDGGPAIEAQLNGPYFIKIDLAGNLYIADRNNYRIRKVSPDGMINTVAGNGIRGNGFYATLAKDSSIPIDAMTVDSIGNIYLSDLYNNHVCKISTEGSIKIIAGIASISGGWSGDGGPATRARLAYPYSLAVDSLGNLYIADSYNSYIRKVSSSGIITTMAGNGVGGFSGDGGSAKNASISVRSIYPGGLAVDPVGNIYIASEKRVRKISPDGIINTEVGTGILGFSGDGGSPINAQIGRSLGIAIGANGNLYITDSENNRIRRVSPVTNTDDNLIITASKDGNELYSFDATGRHLETRNALTNTVIYRFAYEANGLLNTVTDLDNRVTTIERLNDGTPVAISAPDGERTALTLDADGYLKQLSNPAGEMHQMHYLPGGLLDSYTDPNGNPYTYTYDSEGRLVNDQSPTGAGWQFAITNQTNTSRTVSKTSKEGRVTAYKTETLPNNDAQRTITQADGTVTTAITQDNGMTLTTTPNGTKIEEKQGPDPRFSMQAPLPASTKITLPSGLSANAGFARTVTLSNPQNPLSLSQQTDTQTLNGKISTRVYDATTRTFTRTSAENRTGTTRLDPQGRAIQSQISGFNAVNREYDSQGRVSRVYSGSGADLREILYSYYPTGPMQGYLQSVTDALGQTATYQYDPIGRITQQTVADGRIIDFSYDANGNVTRLVPPSRPAHDFSYDGLDQTTEYQPPLLAGLANPITRYSYNKDRQLTLITRPDGQTITPNYHATSGKLDSLSTPQGSTSYTYKTSGQLGSITVPDGNRLNYSYDGALLTQTQWTGTVNGSLSWVYNNDFNVTSQSVNGANSISYSYDNDQLLTQAGDLTLSREAQKAGRLNGTSLGLQTTRHSYTAFGELQSSSASYNGAEQISVQYMRDKLGRISTKIETINGVAHSYDYHYDAGGRLTQVKQDGNIIADYAYDANDNRTQINGVTVAEYDNQDRLTSYNGNTYSYTGNGELQSKTNGSSTTQYSYDVLSNLRQVTLPDNTVIDYLIDGRNRRIGKKVNGSLSQGFLYQDSLRLIAELDSNNQIVSRFVYADKGNVPAYFIKNGVTYRMLSDHLGSPRLIINTADGSVAQQIDYDVWGNITSDTNPGFQPFGFAGGLYDQHTRLVRFGARDYDPETGRWTAKDPIGFGGGDSNLYGYVLHDPVNLVDPSGHFAIAVEVVVAAVATTVVGAAISNAINNVYNSNTTLQPGSHAGDSVPARGPGRDFTQGERDAINDIGRDTGCHTCGTTDPGTKSGNFVPDHQPPTKLNESEEPQDLFPQCINCSRKQGGEVNKAKNCPG